MNFMGPSFSGISTDITSTHYYFIVKYDKDGIPIWAKGANGPDIFRSGRVSVNKNGNVYLTAFFTDSLNIDSTLTIHGTNSATNICVAEFDTDGHILSAKNAESTGDVFIGGIASSGNEEIYIGGCFKGASFPFGRTLLQNPSTSNFTMFLTKLDTLSPTGLIVDRMSTISIYPNPSNAIFYFNGLHPGNAIDIYNMLGQNIYSTIADSENTSINLSLQSKGVYFYRVRDQKDLIQQGKIVKE